MCRMGLMALPIYPNLRLALISQAWGPLAGGAKTLPCIVKIGMKLGGIA
jgi:hypothetical protein